MNTYPQIYSRPYVTSLERRKNAYNYQYGIGVPKGEVARSAAEAESIAKQIGTDHLGVQMKVGLI